MPIGHRVVLKMQYLPYFYCMIAAILYQVLCLMQCLIFFVFVKVSIKVKYERDGPLKLYETVLKQCSVMGLNPKSAHSP